MPTIKQKKAVLEVVGNGGNVTKAMISAGYSQNTANTPQKLTESDGWIELMEEYLPDKLLAKKHKELLNVPKKIRKFIKGELVDEYEELDSQAVSKGLDMGYKLKGKYAAEKKELSGLIQLQQVTGMKVIKDGTGISEQKLKADSSG